VALLALHTKSELVSTMSVIGTFGLSPAGGDFGRNWGYFHRAHGPAGMRALDPKETSQARMQGLGKLIPRPFADDHERRPVGRMGLVRLAPFD